MTVSPETLEALLQAQRYQTAAWQKVIDRARTYAMAVTTGSYIENGNRIGISHGERKRYEEMFGDNLLMAAKDAFFEDAMMGAATQNAKPE
jgi:hypothetical protein